MAGKKVNFGTKPQKKATVDDWVESREASAESLEPSQHKQTEPTDQPSSKSGATGQGEDKSEKQAMKRLTLDIPENLHRRIKGKAVMDGVTMVNMLRKLLEETYG